MRLILASSSPSRLSILRSAGVEPEVIVSEVDERAGVEQLDDPTPRDVVAHLAALKARSVAQRVRGEAAGGLRDGEPAVVIGGDSMLLIENELQGKPHTEEETIRRWRWQRGKVAQLLTGHALIDANTGAEYTDVSSTTVHFAQVSDEDIAAYAATGEPFGCAGAFTLEALGGWFIDRIDGDPSSVIGLSLPVVRRGLEHFGYRTHQFWNR